MDANQIVYTLPAVQLPDYQSISIDQYWKRRAQRRRRVAKRLWAKYPMLAVEMMQAEFPGITYEQLVNDVTRPTRKCQSKRSAKSGLKKYGRYPLYSAALEAYHATKDVKHLIEAQSLRRRLKLDFQFLMMCEGESRMYRCPSTTPLDRVKRIAAFKFTSWAELEKMWDEEHKWL